MRRLLNQLVFLCNKELISNPITTMFFIMRGSTLLDKQALLKVTLIPIVKTTLEQRSTKPLFQNSFGFENQRVNQQFF
jgi:hypothetical protein